MDFFVRNAWLVPALPLLGGLVAAVGGKWLGQRSNLPVIAGIGLAFLVSLGLLFNSTPQATPAIRWLTISGLEIPIQFQVDGLTTMMLAMVTFVATLVTIFASEYMAGDPSYPRFFAIVGLFVTAMTGLVLSSNYLLTYVFWEGVGVCSYLLVGFWHDKPAAALAAKKAFLVNRIGDVGFAIAIFWMWTVVPNHDLSYANVLSSATGKLISHASVVWITLLLFWAATAKSAQVPLYVWLPDAMEGPTPVSALIHAATMVTAGVYLIARSTPLLVLVPGVQLTVAVVGCVTALLAAVIALTQTDLKRVLAYSTVSQLGYMFMALGSGVEGITTFAVIAAMFHLFTHAFFKALLFLGSGSVMHAMGGVIDMRQFGGLRKRLPITYWTFGVGGLALSGIPFFSGFFSKDEVLTAIRLAGRLSNDSGGQGWGWVYYLIYATAIVTAGLTAFYTGRAFFMTFHGPERLPDPAATPTDSEGSTSAVGHNGSHGHGHASGHDGHFGHEGGSLLTLPLIVLAGCAALAGVVFGPTGWFEHHLEMTRELGHAEGALEHGFDWLTAGLGTLVGFLGLGLSYAFYANDARVSPIPARLAGQLAPLYRASLAKFGIDEFYTAVLIWPTRFLGVVADFLDKFLVDGLVQVVAWVPQTVGRQVFGRIQNGLVQYYAAVTALSVGVLFLALLFLV